MKMINMTKAGGLMRQLKPIKQIMLLKNISGNFTIENIEESINAIDEPYSDPSIVPAYLISKKWQNYIK